MKKKWAVVIAAIVMLLAMAIQTVEPIVYAAQSISSSQTVAGNEKTGSQTSSATASTEDEAVTGSSTSSNEATESSAVTDSTTPGTNTSSSSSTTEEANTSSSSSSKKEDESSSSAKSSSEDKDQDDKDALNFSNIVKGMSLLPTVSGRSSDSTPTYSNIAPEYTSDSNGTYPTHSWSPNGQTDVINHQGHNGDSWNSSNDHYIYYGQNGTSDSYDFAIKKYAQETATPGKYDVYLNVKGNANQNLKPLDIMLVGDWSGSMKGDRISALKSGINKFVDAIDQSGVGNQVKLGYIGYSSPGYNQNQVNLGQFDSVKNQIKKLTPSTPAGGTFTQKGLHDAYTQLQNAGDTAKKVIVLLTDGVPTFSYHVNTATQAPRDIPIGTDFDYRKIDIGYSTSQLGKNQNGTRPYISQSGIRIDNTFSATIGEAQKIINGGIQIHGLGIQLTGDDDANLNATDVKNLMERMCSTDENSHLLYYESVNSAQDIVDYLTEKAISLVGTVSQGSIKDPLGSQYIYKSEPDVKSISGGASLPTVTRTGDQVSASNINLSKDQEIQIHYQVQINTEDKNFKPDFWYQMNGQDTTLTPNGSNPTNSVQFGVPSGKAPATKIKIKKVWDEYNKPEKHPDVNFTVGRATTTSDGAWKEATGKLTETTRWEKEFDQLTVDGSDVYLPKFNNEGKDFTYTVKSETQVPGYDIPSIENKDGEWVITNKQKFSPLSLEVTKVSGDNSDLKLAGATFELSGGDLGKTITLTDNGKGTYSLPAGTKLNKDQTYTLTEKTAPAGFEIAPENPWTIKIESTGKVVVTDKDGNKVDSKINQDDADNPVIGLNIADPVKEQEFQVKKYRQGDENKVELAGSEFTLTKYGDKWAEPAGKSMIFAGNGAAQNIKPGYYIVKETKAPTGYQLDDNEYKFYIDDHGKMFDADGNEITKESLAGKEGFYLTDKGLAFVKYDDLKPFDVQMKKVDKDSNQPIKGVTFITGTKLNGNNVVEEASGTTDKDGLLNYQDKNGATYQFEAGKTYYFQETDATNKYQKLKGYFELVITADGKTATLTYHNPDGKPNTVKVNISMDNGNIITFTVTNNAKAPLPETGGHGIIGYVAVGLLLMALAVIGLYANNVYRRRVR